MKKVIVLSDIHLGAKYEDRPALRKFLDKLPAKQELILLGDILDFFSSTPNIQIVKDFLEIFGSLPNRIVYVVGNHDILAKDYFDFGNIEVYPLCYEERIGRKTYFFTHGHQFEATIELEMPLWFYEQISELLCMLKGKWANLFAKLWLLWKFKTRPSIIARLLRTLPREEIFKNVTEMAENVKLREFLFGIRPDHFLVWGHSHSPYVGLHSANAGSWVKYQRTVLEIDLRKAKPVLKSMMG